VKEGADSSNCGEKIKEGRPFMNFGNLNSPTISECDVKMFTSRSMGSCTSPTVDMEELKNTYWNFSTDADTKSNEISLSETKISKVADKGLKKEKKCSSLAQVSENIVNDEELYGDNFENELIPDTRTEKLMKTIKNQAKTGAGHIWSEAIVKTCDNVIQALAWGNAGLLSNAFQITFLYIVDYSNFSAALVLANWIYLSFLCLFCFIFIKKFPYTTLAIDESSTEESDENRKCGLCKRCRKMCKRILRYKHCTCCRYAVEHTVEIERAFFFLAIDTMAVVVSFASSDATMTTFAQIFERGYANGEFYTEEDGDSVGEAAGLMAVTLCYAVGMTLVIIWLMLIFGPSAEKEKKKAKKAGKKKHPKKNYRSGSKESWPNSSSIMSEEPMKRFCQLTAGIVIAWAWRGYFWVFILLILNENSSTAILGFWIYSSVIALIVVIILSVFELFHFVPIYYDLPFQSPSPEREFILRALKSAIIYIVALSVIESFKATFDKFNSGEAELVAQWIYCGLVVVCMIVSNLYLKGLVLGLVGGIASGAIKTVNAIRSSKKKEKKHRETFLRYFLGNVVFVVNQSVSVAAAFAMRDAVRLLLVEVSESTSDIGEGETNWNRLIAGAWIACLISLSISATITIYLTKIINKEKTNVEPDAYGTSSDFGSGIIRYMGNWE